MNRRSFGVLCGSGLLFAVGLLTGCPWATDVENVVSSALTGLSLLLSMLAKNNVILPPTAQSAVTDIQTFAGDIKAALQSGPLTGPVLAQVIGYINDFLQSFQNLINLLPPLPALIVDLIADGIDIILSTIEGYLDNPPIPVPASAIDAHKTAKSRVNWFRRQSLKVIGGTPRPLSFVSKRRNVRQLKHDWNAVEPVEYHL